MERIKVLDIEEKTGSTGKPYLRVRTNNGWYSCFEGDCFETLKGAKNNELDVEVRTKGDYKNITKVEEIGEFPEQPILKKKAEVVKEGFPLSMRVSYAKDLMISDRKITAEEASEIVDRLIELLG